MDPRPATDGLRLTPVGVGAAYAAPGEAQSCYLLHAGVRTVCMDLGAGALNRLQTHLRPERLHAVTVTHLHADHMVDLLSLRVYMAWGPGAGRPLDLWGPPGLRELIAGHGEGGLDEAFRLHDLTPPGGEVDLGDGLRLVYREVPHLPPTFALRFERRGASVCFGADCAPNDALVELARGADVLLCECSFGAGEVPAGVPHLTAGDAGLIAREAGVRRLLLTHCYPEFDRDEALAAARAAAGTAVAVDWAVQDRPVDA